MFVQKAVHSGVPTTVGQLDPVQRPESSSPPPSETPPESSPPHAAARSAMTSIVFSEEREHEVAIYYGAGTGWHSAVVLLPPTTWFRIRHWSSESQPTSTQCELTQT
jgi:hypothetical protein